MSDVVTSTTAAISQFGLFAPRQQVFVVERGGSAPDDATALNLNPRNSLHSPTQSALETRRDEAIASVQRDGPSRARIEIHSLEMGLTPADTTGAFDLQSSDSPVDLTAAEKAALAQQNGTAPTPAGNAAGSEPKKIIVTTGDGTVQTIVANTGAAGAAATGIVEVPKRLYGQGTEVAIGPTVAQKTDANTKPAVADPKAPKLEDGTGEVKLYDKVAQTEQGQSQADNPPTGEGALFEKARAIAAATTGGKKTVLVAAAYSNTAAITTDQAPVSAKAVTA